MDWNIIRWDRGNDAGKNNHFTEDDLIQKADENLLQEHTGSLWQSQHMNPQYIILSTLTTGSFLTIKESFLKAITYAPVNP